MMICDEWLSRPQNPIMDGLKLDERREQESMARADNVKPPAIKANNQLVAPDYLPLFINTLLPTVKGFNIIVVDN
jgi:hypothetical protein